MAEVTSNEYAPDYVSSPGDILKDTLSALDMSQAELARRAGRPEKTISGIVHANTQITPETALQFERVLGIPASFWSNLERNYQEYLARYQERATLSKETSWLRKPPIREIIKNGWVQKVDDPIDQLREVLKFFAIASFNEWEPLRSRTQGKFRKSATFESDEIALLAWLRRGEIDASEIDCAEYNATAFKECLQEIRLLTREAPKEFVPRARRLCAASGVALVFVPQLEKSRVSGAARWPTPRKALIQLSLRYKRNDILWFSFFHEAAHILLHAKASIFLDDKKRAGEMPQQEKEADNFAAEMLIPRSHYQDFARRSDFGKPAITAFAKRLDIAPGIVVGRLQHDRYLKHNQRTDLIVHLRWAQ